MKYIVKKDKFTKADRQGAVYEAFAGRQTDAEWPKLKVCDLDEVQGSACGA